MSYSGTGLTYEFVFYVCLVTLFKLVNIYLNTVNIQLTVKRMATSFGSFVKQSLLFKA